MTDSVVQLLVLAGIAIFLILRLRAVLGTREGFERPPEPSSADKAANNNSGRFDPVSDNKDRDIIDHVPENSAPALALENIKAAEPSFNVGEFIHGARGAYEMILMAFENGDVGSIRPFISDEIYESFHQAIKDRESKGLKIEASFVGVREIVLTEAEFDHRTQEAEITMRLVGELTSAVINSDGQIVEGSTSEIKRQKDVWTFARTIGSGDPNWQLVSTE